MVAALRSAPLAQDEEKTVGKNDDKEDDKEDDKKDKDDGGGRHRDEDNTGDGHRNRPIPPPSDPSKHDR